MAPSAIPPGSISSPSSPRLPIPNAISFPPLEGLSRTFAFDSQLTSQLRSADPFWRGVISEFTKQSRVILYDNGAFALQYDLTISGPYTYRGQYREANGVLAVLFEFQGRPAEEAWDDATATLQGDALSLEFEVSMQHADFENAVYTLRR